MLIEVDKRIVQNQKKRHFVKVKFGIFKILCPKLSFKAAKSDFCENHAFSTPFSYLHYFGFSSDLGTTLVKFRKKLLWAVQICKLLATISY